MRPVPVRAIVRIALALLSPVACLPYTVGSTAQTVSAGQTRRAATMYFIPDAIDLSGDSVGAALRGVDVEIRHGLDDRSDIGLRVPAFSGGVVTYKRRVAGTSAVTSPAVSFALGGGFVNWGEHMEMEATVSASGPAGGTVTPYGGLRAIHVVPLSATGVRDEPSAGGFFGLRVTFGDLEVSPEIGVFHDPSALHLRRRNVIVVPGITFARRSAHR